MLTATNYIDVARMAHALGKPQGRGDSFKCVCPAHEDDSPSLKLTLKEDRLLWYCHAGCDFMAVKNALIARFPEYKDAISPRFRTPKDYCGRRLILDTYPYYNLDGTLQFEKVRLTSRSTKKDKDFTLRAKDRRGEWTYEGVLDGLVPVIYKLPEISKAIGQGQTIFFVEGEKDANRLWTLGLPATTLFASSASWQGEYTEWLRAAKRVVVVPDNDQTGHDYAIKVATALRSAGVAVCIMELFGLQYKEDVSDWLDAELGGKAELETLADEAVPFAETCFLFTTVFEQTNQPDNVVSISSARKGGGKAGGDPTRLPLNDEANGKRFANMFGQDVRYRPSKDAKGGTWYKWDERRFAPVCNEVIEQLGFQVGHSLENEDYHDPEKRNKWWARSLSMAGCRNTLNAAKSQAAILREEFGGDNHRFLLNCPNGILDLEKQEVLDHDRNFEMTQITGCKVDLNNPWPELWLEFLDKVTGSNGELMNFLQRLCGYLLSGSIKEQCFFILFGPGGNGKSVFLDTIMSILKDYSVNTRTEMWLQTSTKDQEDNPNRLYGKRLAGGAEIDQHARLDESLIKKVTGDKQITGRVLYEEAFQFDSTCKVMLLANNLPTIKGTDEGIWRRVVPIPFNVKLSESEKDPDLPKKLEQEYPQILGWMADGYREYKEKGLLRDPKTGKSALPFCVTALKEQYKEEQDIYQQCVEDCTEESLTESVFAQDLYEVYKLWSQECGLRVVTIHTFGKEMKKKLERFDGDRLRRKYLGIKFRPEWLERLEQEKQKNGSQKQREQKAPKQKYIFSPEEKDE